MATKFALAKMPIVMPDGIIVTFLFDSNGKITAGNGTFSSPTPNSFSLVQVEDCPFATSICASVCYVHRLEKTEKEVHLAYRHNSQAIRKVLASPLYRIATEKSFAAWIFCHSQAGFRWHVSGDIFSYQYAEFIRSVCSSIPQIPFWIYTRSFAYIAPLLGVSNLVLNLSADQDNFEDALRVSQIFGLRICYLTIDGTIPPQLPDGSVIFPNHELRGRDLPDPKQASWWLSLSARERRMVCPPDFFGQSESLRCGPCKKCLRNP